MKAAITQARRFKLPKQLKKILLILFPLFVFDISVAVSAGFYLSSENEGAFLGRSIAVNLSNLLFIEGAVIFTIGSFVAYMKPRKKSSDEPKLEATDRTRRILEKLKNPVVSIIVIGLILIVLSIIIGSLPH